MYSPRLSVKIRTLSTTAASSAPAASDEAMCSKEPHHAVAPDLVSGVVATTPRSMYVPGHTPVALGLVCPAFVANMGIRRWQDHMALRAAGPLAGEPCAKRLISAAVSPNVRCVPVPWAQPSRARPPR